MLWVHFSGHQSSTWRSEFNSEPPPSSHICFQPAFGSQPIWFQLFTKTSRMWVSTLPYGNACQRFSQFLIMELRVYLICYFWRSELHSSSISSFQSSQFRSTSTLLMEISLPLFFSCKFKFSSSSTPGNFWAQLHFYSWRSEFSLFCNRAGLTLALFLLLEIWVPLIF